MTEPSGPDPVGAERRRALQARAASFVDELLALPPLSPSFSAKLGSLSSLGEPDLRAAAVLSARFVSRPAQTGGGPDAQGRVAATLARLRAIVARLDPSRERLGGVRRLVGSVTGRDPVTDYFDRYRSSQVELDSVLTELVAGQDDLRRDNAAIEAQAVDGRAVLTRLAEYDVLAASLDAGLTSGAGGLDASGRTDHARAIATEALTAVRRRRLDLATQAAVTGQAVLVLDVVRDTNLELIRGVERARRTTLTALRTAVVASRSLQQQSLVLDRIAALPAAAVTVLEAGLTPDLPGLERAFAEVHASLDDADAVRSRARAALGDPGPAPGSPVAPGSS